MVVGGDDEPEVGSAVVQDARVTGRRGCIVAGEEVVGRAVAGLKVDGVGDRITRVGVTAGPTQVYVEVLTGGAVGGRGIAGFVGRVVGSDMQRDRHGHGVLVGVGVVDDEVGVIVPQVQPCGIQDHIRGQRVTG